MYGVTRWIPLKKYPNYEGNNFGDIRNTKTKQVLRPGLKSNGYLLVVLRGEDNKSHTELVHRLIADAFYDGNHDGLIVNHIDGNKTNNFVGNLEWCSYRENALHAYRIGLRKPTPPTNETRKVMIVETGEVFNSIRECAAYINGNHRHISDCLNGKLRSHKGLHYVEVF